MNKFTSSCIQCSNTFFIRDPNHPLQSRGPQLLPCGHSACSKCVTHSLSSNDKIHCKICNVSFGNEKKFPINYFLMGSVLDWQNNREKIDESSIRLVPVASVTSKTAVNNKDKIRICCECALQPASSQCDKCKDVYCSPCFIKVHSAGRSLKQHRKIFLSESVTNSCKLAMCAEHPETPCNIFCENDNVVVCPSCAIAGHNGHRLLQIADKNKELIPEMQKVSREAAKVLKTLAGAQKTLQKLPPCGDSEQLKETRKELKQHFVLLHSFLQLKETSLIQELESGHLSSLKDTTTMVTEIDAQVLQLQELLHDVHTALEPDMLSNVDLTNMLKKLKEIVNLPCKLKLPEQNNLLSAKFEAEDVKTVVEKHCKLHMETPALPTLISLLPEELDAVDVQSSSSSDDELQIIEGSSNSSFEASNSKKMLNVIGRGKHESFQPTNKNTALKFESLASKSNSKPQQFDPVEMIVLSHVETPGSFYVQRTKDLSAIRQMVRDIKIAEPASKICADPIPGNLYLVKFHQDQAWYRGRVTQMYRNEKNEKIADVFFIDYGNTDTMKTNKIKMLPPSLSYTYPLSIHCNLANIEPVGVNWSEEATTTFLEMAASPKVQMIVKDTEGTILHVDLLLVNTDCVSSYQPQSVRDTLLFLNLGHLKTPQSPPVRMLQQERKFFTLYFDLRPSSSHNVIVSHVDSPHCFYVQRLGEYGNHLKKMMEKLKAFYNNEKNTLKIYSPQIGMQCVAKYPHDGCWYRATVTGLPEKCKITVFYVDYGNSETLDWFDVKKLHDTFTQFDAQAICCKLSDVAMGVGEDTWTPEAVHMLQSFTYQKELRMVVDQRLKEAVEVTLYESHGHNEICINTKFVRAGFGRSKGKRKSTFNHSSTNTQVYKRPYIQNSTAMETNEQTVFELPLPAARRKNVSPIKAILGPSLLNSTPPKTFSNQALTTNVMPTPHVNSGTVETEKLHRIQVEVLSHNTPGEIYVKILRQQEELDTMMQQMQEFYNKEAKIEKNEWEIGDLCVVHRALDNRWYRAVIIDIQDAASKVFLVDIAEALQLQTSKLRTASADFTKQIHGAVRCHLADIKAAGDRPDMWPLMAGEELTRLLHSYRETYITKKGNIEKGSLPIELWVEKTTNSGALEPIVISWVTINQLLVNEGVALPIKNPDVITITSDQVLEDLKILCGKNSSKPSPEYWNKFFKSDLSSDTLKTVKKLLETSEEPMDDDPNIPDWPKAELPSTPFFEAVASHVDDQCFIYLQEQPNSEHALNKILRIAQRDYADAKPKVTQWSPGEICMALYHADDKWYRGKIVKVPENKAEELTVLFVDYGNCEEVSAMNLHKVINLISIPVQCFKCQLVTITPRTEDGVWLTDDLDLLHGCIVDKKCDVTLIEMPQQGEPVKVMKLVTELGRDVIEYMISSKLCKRVPITSLTPNSTDNSIENISTDIASATTNVIEAGSEEKANSDSDMKDMSIIQEKIITTENGTLNEKIIEDMNISSKSMEVEVPDVKIETVTETGVKDMPNIPIQEAAKDEHVQPLLLETIKNETLELVTTYSSNSSEQEVVTISDSDDDSDETSSSEDYDDSEESESEVEPLFNYSHFNVDVGTMIEAEVVVVISPVEMFLKPLKSHMLNSKVPPKKDPLAALQGEMRKKGPKQPLLQDVTPGLPCCCCYMTEDDWYRAVVLEVKKAKSSAVISFVDYGNTEEVTLSKLHCIKPEWMGLPTQALHCKVESVKIPENVDTNLLQLGVHDALLDGPVVIKFKTVEKPFIVELLQADRETSVYKNMIDQNIAEFIK